MKFIGVDPGMSGALATIDWEESGEEARAVPFKDMTCKDINDLFLVNRGAQLAILENVHAIFQQGKASSFKFGKSFGGLEAFLYAHGIPFELKTPQTWQKEIGCLSHGDKNVTKAKAQQLFPQLKVTHSTADALLIAEYTKRLWMARNRLAAAV